MFKVPAFSVVVLSVVAFFAAVVLAPAHTLAKPKPNAIAGKYVSPKSDGVVEFYRGKNKQYYAKVIWEKVDTGAVGKVVFKHLKFKDGKWVDGKVYDPDRNKWFDAEIEKKGANLKVRGYLGAKMFGRTVILRKLTQANKPSGYEG